MEGESWSMHHGGGIMEEVTQESPEVPRSTRRHPGGTTRHPGGSQESPRSESVSVFVSVPILLLLLGAFEGPTRLRAAGQRLRDPR